MGGLIKASRRSILSPCKTLIPQLRPQRQFSPETNRTIFNFLATQTRTLTSEPPQKSPFESNILRILGTEIEYQKTYAPLQQPVTKFHAYTVEDRPGEQWITMRGKFGEDEDIKIEATMFDGAVLVPKSGDNGTQEGVRLHISLLVDIYRGESGDALEFVCSAWPGRLEIQKVYVFKSGGLVPQAYMGPYFRGLNSKLRNALSYFLEERGVNDDLSVFLHNFMVDKDRTELIRWLGKLKYFVEK